MNIVSFEKEHIDEAKAIALANYQEERQFVKDLPEISELPDLNELAGNGLGVAAFEQGKMVGFLCCYKPWDNAFGTAAKGTFSPIYAHGAVAENREMIYRKLYQTAAEKWVAHGITYHAIAMYAHDEQALRAFFLYGFGVRCVDAIRDMSGINYHAVPDLQFRELPKEEIAKIREMRRQLSEHLGSSPCFMYSNEQEFKQWLIRAENRETDVYVAELDGEPVSFIEIADDGETFVTEKEEMKNICGAFCMPEYRGSGVFANLLNYVVDRLRQQGITHLGVDFESYNPAGSGAWNKYFTPYTHSVVRRIDECALRNYK